MLFFIETSSNNTKPLKLPIIITKPVFHFWKQWAVNKIQFNVEIKLALEFENKAHMSASQKDDSEIDNFHLLLYCYLYLRCPYALTSCCICSLWKFIWSLGKHVYCNFFYLILFEMRNLLSAYVGNHLL